MSAVAEHFEVITMGRIGVDVYPQQVGVSLLLLQCSPQLEEMERFAEQVMPLVREGRTAAVA